jgi:hypothetical protein
MKGDQKLGEGDPEAREIINAIDTCRLSLEPTVN